MSSLARALRLALCVVLPSCSPTTPTAPSGDEPASVPLDGVGGARAPLEPLPLPGASGGTESDPQNPWLQPVGAAGAASHGAGGASTEDGGASNGGSNESGAGGGGSGGVSSGGTGGTSEPEKPPKLLLSQYFEGAGSDKALELTNVGSDPAKLSLCELSLYTNGSSTPYRTSPLSGVLEPGASIVYCSTALAEGLAGRCAGSLSALVYNGDDALVLRCLDEASDRLGRVGEDPGEAWGTAPSTKNANLTRRCSVSTGDVAFEAPFEPAVEWSALPLTELGDLGLWTCPDPGAGGAGGLSLTSPE